MSSTEARQRLRRLLRPIVRNHHCRALLALMTTAWLVQVGSWENLLTRTMGGALQSDGSSFVWYFWHLKEALLGRRDILFSNQFFYPVGLHLIRQDWAPMAGLLALPFQVLGPVAAHNCELLLALVSCGYFTYLLARQVCRHDGYALLAGFVFAFCEFRLSKAAGHTSQANQQFLPLFLFWLVRFADRRQIRSAIWAGVSLVLAALCSPYQAVYALLLTLCFYSYRLLAATARAGFRRLGDELRAATFFCGVSGAVALTLMSPLLLTQWELVREGESVASRVAATRIANPSMSLDLLSLVLSPHTNLSVAVISAEGRTGHIGYSVLVLLVVSVVGLRRRPAAGLWLFAAAVFLYLACGGLVVVGGEVVARLPALGLTRALPIVRDASVPARFVSMFALCAGLGIATSLATWHRSQLAQGAVRLARWTAVCLVTVPYLELTLLSANRRLEWAAAAPSVSFPAAFSEIAAQGPGITVLYVPPIWETNLRSVGGFGTYARRRFADATRHVARICDGIGDLTPDETLEYFRRLPLMRDLIPSRPGETPHPLEPSLRREARYVASQLGIRYVVLDSDIVSTGRDPDGRLRRAYRERAAHFLRSTLKLEALGKDAHGSYWRVAEPLDDPPPLITFDHEGSLVHLGPGWQRMRAGGQWYARRSFHAGPDGVLFLSVPAGCRSLSLIARCRPGPCAARTDLDGHGRGRLRLTGGWRRHDLPLGGPRATGMRRLRLEPAPSQHPRLVGRTGVRCPAPVRVISRGLPAGNRASVLVDGVEHAPNLRGHNLVVVDPATGRVTAAQAFDLVGDHAGVEGARLAAFVDRIAKGRIVIDAVKDDGALHVTPAVRSALRSIGAEVELAGHFRHSYAIVGVKGASPGTADERLAATPVEITLRPQIEVLRIEFRPANGAS